MENNQTTKVEQVERVGYNSYGDAAGLKAIRSRAIWALVFTILFIFAPIALILNIINIVKIMGTTWEDPKKENSKVLWGLLTIFLLGPIASLIFSA